MTNRIRKALALQSATAPAISAPVAPIGHNAAPAAPVKNAARDNVATWRPSEAQLKKVAELVASGVRNKYETRAAIIAALGEKPSDAVKAEVRRAFCIAHMTANAKVELADMTPGGRAKWVKTVYDNGKVRADKSPELRAYNAAKAAWSLALADAGLSGAKTTKDKNDQQRGANERREPAGEGETAPVGAPAKAVSAADAVAHVMGQANLLQMFCNKNAGVVPGTIADAVARLYTACTLSAKPE